MPAASRPIVKPDLLQARWSRLSHPLLTVLCLGALPISSGAGEPATWTVGLPQPADEVLPLQLRLDTGPGQMPEQADGRAALPQRPRPRNRAMAIDIKAGTGRKIGTVPEASATPTLRLDQVLRQVPADPSSGRAMSTVSATPQAMASSGKPRNAEHAESLLLELSVNGQGLAGTSRVERLEDQRLVLPLDVWATTRLTAPAAGTIALPDEQRGYALQDVPGLDYILDRSQQTLQITAPASAFQETSLVLGGGRDRPPKPAPPGLYLNYDAAVTHTQGSPDTGGLVLEGIAFSGPDSLVSGAVVSHDGTRRKTLRTETYWRRDLPGSMEALVLGDSIGSSGAWSRPVRFGGIRFARDFSLAPSYITYPVPILRGSAALPSTVDVIVNNQRRSSGLNVGSGPFDLSNVPVVSGSGEVNLVVRDLRGVETVVTQQYYLSPRLLAPSLSDFSIDAGRLRRNFGLADSGYGPGFAAATYRYGLNAALTAEGRVEVQKTRQAAGIGFAGLAGILGVAQATAAWSRSDSDGRESPRSGGRYLLAFERSAARGGNGSLQWEHFDAGFRQFGDLGTEARPHNRLQAQTGTSLAGLALGLSYTRQTTWEGDNFRLLAFNIGTPVFDRLFLSLYANKRLGPGGGWSAGLSVLMPLEKQRSIAATSNRDDGGRLTTAVQASQSPPVGPGWGWRARVSDQARQQAQAGAILNTDFGQFQAEANAGSGNNAVRFAASGSAGWLAGLPFATRRIDHGAFAVVRVADLANVPVYRSNQLVATTNHEGLALVTGLRPYQQNQLSINPDELPLNINIEGVEELVIPYARSGVLVEFPVRRMRNALVVIHQPDGIPVPAGTRIKLLPDKGTFIVGRRGEAYLTDLENSNHLQVTGTGVACELFVVLNPTQDSEPRIGPLTCGPGM